MLLSNKDLSSVHSRWTWFRRQKKTDLFESVPRKESWSSLSFSSSLYFFVWYSFPPSVDEQLTHFQAFFVLSSLDATSISRLSRSHFPWNPCLASGSLLVSCCVSFFHAFDSLLQEKREEAGKEEEEDEGNEWRIAGQEDFYYFSPESLLSSLLFLQSVQPSSSCVVRSCGRSLLKTDAKRREEAESEALLFSFSLSTSSCKSIRKVVKRILLLLDLLSLMSCFCMCFSWRQRRFRREEHEI